MVSQHTKFKCGESWWANYCKFYLRSNLVYRRTSSGLLEKKGERDEKNIERRKKDKRETVKKKEMEEKKKIMKIKKRVDKKREK